MSLIDIKVAVAEESIHSNNCSRRVLPVPFLRLIFHPRTFQPAHQ